MRTLPFALRAHLKTFFLSWAGPPTAKLSVIKGLLLLLLIGLLLPFFVLLAIILLQPVRFANCINTILSFSLDYFSNFDNDDCVHCIFLPQILI